MIAMVVVTAAIVSSLAVHKSGKTSLDDEVQKFVAIEAGRDGSIEEYLASILDDLGAMSTNETMLHSLRDFTAAWNELPVADKTAYLQKLYIDDNKNPAGSKQLLDTADDGTTYAQVHKKRHPWLRSFVDKKEFYDLFLISKSGDIVYTDFKERDFATNVLSGEWKDSDIGSIFKKVRDNATPGYQAFTDFHPYAPSANVPAAFVGAPILDENGEFEGALVFQMPIGHINKIMQAAEGLGETGETYLVGGDFLMRSDSRLSKESTILKTKVDSDAVKESLNGEEGFNIGKNHEGIDHITVHSYVDFLGTRWAVIGEIELAEVMGPINDMRNQIILASLAVVLITAILAIFIARGISGPISGMNTAMKKLAGGDHGISIPGVGRADEIGDMAGAVQVFKDNAIETERLRREQAALEARAAEEKKKAMNELADRFQSQVGSIVNAISSAATELQATAEGMTDSASETAQQSNTVAAAAEQASANVQTVSAATEELTASIQEIQQRVRESTHMIGKAVAEADQANKKVQGLTEAARKIGDVISLINDIAAQTNLLALNATIEAARAGEAGKGFAVVAAEVKNLATQTAKATDEIAQQINGIQSETNSSAAAIKSITHAISSVSETATAISAAVEQQGAATQEIARNVNEAAHGTKEVSTSIIKVSGAAQRTGASAAQVSAAASELAESGERMRSSVHKFLGDIRGS